MKNYYADFLQTTDFENMPGKAVSKVSKGYKYEPKQPFDTFDTPQSSVNQKIRFQKTKTSKSAESASLETIRNAESSPALTERLNRIIAVGAFFDVGTDDFQVMNADRLTAEEKNFLAVNKAAILCTLHQSALMKYLPLDYIPRFKNEINGRAAILFDGAETEPPFEVVAEVAREWFVDVLEEMLKR